MIGQRRAVIFDFGGVLMKTVDHTPRLRWDARLGLPPGSVERVVHGSESWLRAQSGQLSTSAYWADVAAQLGLTADAVTQLAEDFYSGDQLDTTLIAIIHRLRADGHTVGLLSNDTAELLEKLTRLAVANVFSPLVISAQIGVMKPDIRAYQAVLQRLALPPDHVIFIDDRLENIAGARQAGLIGIHYVDGMDVAAALSPLLIV